MSHPPSDCLVDTAWLARHLESPDVLILDGSWHLPGTNRDGRSEYLEKRIPGALFFDIDEVSDEDSDLPHMLPSTVKFASRIKKLGIGSGCRVVVYDSLGIYSAARVWWMFRVMGHTDVYVLDGGLPKWIAEGRPVEDGSPQLRAALHFMPKFDNGLVADIDDVRAIVKADGAQIVDARPGPRFRGDADEPRPGLRRGHIPRSKNVPYDSVVNADGTLKSPDEIRAAFDAADVDTRKPIVTTCGSGVTAAILALALARIGNPTAAVYDGSFAEWGRPNGLPVETG